MAREGGPEVGLPAREGGRGLNRELSQGGQGLVVVVVVVGIPSRHGGGGGAWLSAPATAAGPCLRGVDYYVGGYGAGAGCPGRVQGGSRTGVGRARVRVNSAESLVKPAGCALQPCPLAAAPTTVRMHALRFVLDDGGGLC